MSAPKWVVAGNSQEYMDWLNRNGANRMEWRYVSDVSIIRGHSDPHGIFIGSYYMRPDIKDIMLQLQIATHGTNDAITEAWKKAELYAPKPL